MEKKLLFVAADSEELLVEAAALINKEYAKDGYVDLLPKEQVIVSKYSKLPTTKTFVALLNERVVATVAVVMYGELGVPMEAIYQTELAPLVKKTAGQLAEISQLAIDRELEVVTGISQRKLQALILPELFRLVFYYALAQQIEKLCIVINPKHDVFYAALGFEAIGELKYYPNVKNAPALPRALDVRRLLSGENENMLSRAVLAKPLTEKDFANKAKDACLFEVEV